MTQTFSFNVTVTVEHRAGKFVPADALKKQIATSLESAHDELWRGIDVGNSEYEIKQWLVAEERVSGNDG